MTTRLHMLFGEPGWQTHNESNNGNFGSKSCTKTEAREIRGPSPPQAWQPQFIADQPSHPSLQRTRPCDLPWRCPPPLSELSQLRRRRVFVTPPFDGWPTETPIVIWDGRFGGNRPCPSCFPLFSVFFCEPPPPSPFRVELGPSDYCSCPSRLQIFACC